MFVEPLKVTQIRDKENGEKKFFFAFQFLKKKVFAKIVGQKRQQKCTDIQRCRAGLAEYNKRKCKKKSPFLKLRIRVNIIKNYFGYLPNQP